MEILKISGYDSEISVELLDKEKLSEIENFVETNFGCTSEFVKGTVYENKEIFRFLPGHVTLLLGLKSYANFFIESGFKKKNKKQPNSVQGREKVGDSVDELETMREEVEVPTANELNRSKCALITKLSYFCKKQNIAMEYITDQSFREDLQVIINTTGEIVLKCVLHCLCEVRIPCIHKQYWQVANVEKHLKIHKTLKPAPEITQQLNQILLKSS